MQLDPASDRQILAPEWLAHRYDPIHDAIHFVNADRALRRSVPFLIDANLPSSTAPVIVTRADALAAAPDPAPIHFIFHSAYCCSTMLANIFDLPGLASSVKEPMILNDLVGWSHRGGRTEAVGDCLESALDLLARPFVSGESVVVKPSNLINALAPTIMERRQEARCILLYAPLPVYLGSIAAKGMWGRLWVRELLVKQLRDGLIDMGFTSDDHLQHTDLQVAAIGWLAQHALFAEMAGRLPDRVKMLDSEKLLAAPGRAIAAVATQFGLAMSSMMLADILESDAFVKNSKDGRHFGQADRLVAQESSAAVHADELAKVLVWAHAVAATIGLDLTTSDPRLHLAI